jgi:hypothetical protein
LGRMRRRGRKARQCERLMRRMGQQGLVDSQLPIYPSGSPDTFPAVVFQPGDPA